MLWSENEQLQALAEEMHMRYRGAETCESH